MDNNNKHYWKVQIMTVNQNQKYDSYTKKAWVIYSVATIVLAAVLVFFVASDAEEMFFFGMMTVAAAYVLRPSEKVMAKKILKYTGVSKSAEEE